MSSRFRWAGFGVGAGVGVGFGASVGSIRSYRKSPCPIVGHTSGVTSGKIQSTLEIGEHHESFLC